MSSALILKKNDDDEFGFAAEKGTLLGWSPEYKLLLEEPEQKKGKDGIDVSWISFSDPKMHWLNDNYPDDIYALDLHEGKKMPKLYLNKDMNLHLKNVLNDPSKKTSYKTVSRDLMFQTITTGILSQLITSALIEFKNTVDEQNLDENNNDPNNIANTAWEEMTDWKRNNKVRTEFEDDLNVNCEKWKPFIDAANSKIENTVQIANAPGLISKRAFSIRIPPRKIEIPEIKEKIKGHTNAKVELSLKRESKSLNIHEESNRIALIRGFGMVVDYHRPDREPLSSDMPYFGVVKTGKLNGEKVEDIVSEIFFKDLEPALHDRWDKKTDGLKNKYSGYADTVDDFYSRIDENLMEMCGEEEAESDKGPQILSDMLQMGFKGKSNEVKIYS